MQNLNWKICGHKKIVAHLQQSFLREKLAHAYIFSGAKNLGKETVAFELFKTLECSSSDNLPCGECQNCLMLEKRIHPDLEIIKPEGKVIPIEKIRSLSSKMSQKPFFSKYKLALIKESEKMNKNASNALLKILEEPSGNTVFVLLSKNSSFLLETIQSRSQLFSFRPVENNEIVNFIQEEKGGSLTEEYLELSHGAPGRVLGFLEDPEIFEESKTLRNDLLSFFSSSFAERSLYLEKLKDSSQMFVFLCELQQLLRLMLLLKLEIPKKEESKRLKQIANYYSENEIIALIKEVEGVMQGIGQNFNTKLLFQNLFLNFK